MPNPDTVQQLETEPQQGSEQERIGWKQQLSFWLVCFVGALWCLFLLGSYATARVDLILASSFFHYPLVAGLILFVLVAHAVAMGPRQLGSGHGGPFEEIISTKKRHKMTWLACIVLLVPLAAAWRYGGDNFSFDAIERQGLDPDNGGNERFRTEAFDAQSLEEQFPPDALGDRPLSMLELVGAAGDERMRALLAQERVVLEGQLAPWPKNREGGDNKLLFYQLMITCCATDRVPLTSELNMEETNPWEGELKGAWAQVRGRITFVQDPQSGYWRPQVLVNSTQAIEAPVDPFVQRF